MTRDTPTIVVLGATGFTGRLVAGVLASGDAPFLLTARDPIRLRRLADGTGAPTQTVDVLDPDSLGRVLRPGDAVINTVGPFTELGEPVVRACIDAGVHYFDTTGEQPWMHDIQQRYDGAARDAGVTVVNAMAFEYALGDCTLAVAAAGSDPVSADIIYAWRGAASSRGTRRTAIRMIGRRGLVRVAGRFLKRPQAARQRTVELESGTRVRAVAFNAGEVVTAPRYLDIDTVRGWMVMDAWAARIAPWLSPALPVLVPLFRPLIERLVARAPDPTDAERRASRFTIRVELGTASGPVAFEVSGRDPYGLTAEIAVRGALRALEPDAPRGVLAPSQLMDPRRLLEALRPHGLDPVGAPRPGNPRNGGGTVV